MDLEAIKGNVADQEKGREFELLDPVTGAPTGMTLRIAGPDSQTQRRAELAMVDRLAEMAGPDGRVAARDREAARLEALAACVLDWNVTEGGEALKFSTANVIRFLRLARWIENQVDSFAGDRGAYHGGGE